MGNANRAFHVYLPALEENNSDDIIEEALQRHKTIRKQ